MTGRISTGRSSASTVSDAADACVTARMQVGRVHDLTGARRGDVRAQCGRPPVRPKARRRRDGRKSFEFVGRLFVLAFEDAFTLSHDRGGGGSSRLASAQCVARAGLRPGSARLGSRRWTVPAAPVRPRRASRRPRSSPRSRLPQRRHRRATGIHHAVDPDAVGHRDGQNEQGDRRERAAGDQHRARRVRAISPAFARY